MVDGNAEEVHIFSPLDEFVKAGGGGGVLYNYQWVDISFVKSPLKKYIYDGPSWYDRNRLKLMLETGVCKWRHVELGFQATSHRPASDLASIVNKVCSIWQEVGIMLAMLARSMT